MKSLFPISILLLLASCSTMRQQGLYSDSSATFKGRYANFLEEGEVETKSWYHYVQSEKTDDTYMLRVFFPETRQITREETYADKKLTTLHGQAMYWHENGNKNRQGMYSAGKETGNWKTYHRTTGKLSAEGIYKEGAKIGVWKYYDTEGRLTEELVYADDIRSGPFVRYDSLQQITNQGHYRADTVYSQTLEIEKSEMERVEEMPYLSSCKGIEDREARYECSTEKLLTYIYRSLKYPPLPRRLGMQGMVIAQFVVQKDGTVTDIDIVRGLCQDFKNECERVLHQLPPWEAGVQDGKKVKVLYTLPIRFKLE